MKRQINQTAIHRKPKNPIESLLLEKSQMTGEKPMSNKLVIAMVQLWMPRIVEKFLSKPPRQQKI